MTKESLHPHAVEREKGYNPYVSLVRELFHFVRKRKKWSKQEMEKNYRTLHNYCENTIPDYKEASVDEQRLFLCIGVLSDLNSETPEPSSKNGNFTHDRMVI